MYVAGPLGFFEAGRHYHREVMLPALAHAGFEVFDPWEKGAARFKGISARLDHASADQLAGVNSLVGHDNKEMIQAADYLLAVLDGSDVDSGTAAEIGYAAALSKPVLGIRSDIRMSGDNAGSQINLQVSYFIGLSGGSIVATFADAVAKLKEWRLDGSPPDL